MDTKKQDMSQSSAPEPEEGKTRKCDCSDHPNSAAMRLKQREYKSGHDKQHVMTNRNSKA